MFMRLFIFLFVASFLPILAVAQSYSKSPMVVIGGEAPAPVTAAAAPEKPANALTNFPEQAITQVGTNSNPDKALIGVQSSAKAPDNASPTAPASSPPVSKLWPRDTIQIFMPRCTSLKVPFVAPCRCVINKLMSTMGHDEFLKKSEDNTIEQDPRLIQIRNECAAAPQRKE